MSGVRIATPVIMNKGPLSHTPANANRLEDGPSPRFLRRIIAYQHAASAAGETKETTTIHVRSDVVGGNSATVGDQNATPPAMKLVVAEARLLMASRKPSQPERPNAATVTR